jgi:putative ABC transport system substrate-binding protein
MSEGALVGRRLQDRYRIVRELGSSAFGTVCVADDEATAQRVAIRFLPHRVTALSSVARVVHSMSQSIAGSAPHPGLVRVLELGEAEPGRHFVVMELVEGRRLSEILSAGTPLNVTTARRWALDLGGAVEGLHNLGLVHAAVRPSNVMVLADGRVKLMDVELAGLRDTPSPAGDPAAGSPAEYITPEQVRRSPVTEKTDVYAFAVVVYQMFCGVPPFQAPTRDAILAKHLSEPPPSMRRRRDVAVAVERIVTQALDKDPEQRPWMHEMLNGLWGETSGSAAGVAAARWKRPAAIAAASAVAVSIILLGAWGLLRFRTSAERPIALSAPAAPGVARPTASPPANVPPSAPAAPARPESAAGPAAPAAVAPAAPKPTPPPSAAPAPALALAPAKPSAPAVETRAAPAAGPASPALPAPAARATPPAASSPPRAAAVTPGSREPLTTAVAEVQRQKRTYRVGWLDSGRVSASDQEIVRQSLVGYPRDIGFEYRSADGRTERLPELAAELVHLKVDVVFAVGNQAIQAAKQATSTIPIVMLGSDAVGLGAGARRDDSSANVTGVTYSSADLAVGWLKLLKEVRPTLTRVAVLDGADPASRVDLTNLQLAAERAGVRIQSHSVHQADALGALFAGSPDGRPEAIVVPGGPLAMAHLSRIVDVARRAGVPAIYGSGEFADAGGLLAYGPSTPAMYRRAGAFIGKILGPTNPRDLPVEQPSRYELVVNLKTARALGLTLPEPLVLRADRVLK